MFPSTVDYRDRSGNAIRGRWTQRRGNRRGSCRLPPAAQAGIENIFSIKLLAASTAK
jgi:hypothetical protein